MTKEESRRRCDDKTFKCDLCEFKTLYKNGLKQHKLSNHEGKKYNCDTCIYVTAYPSNIYKHKLLKHIKPNEHYISLQNPPEESNTINLKIDEVGNTSKNSSVHDKIWV